MTYSTIFARWLLSHTFTQQHVKEPGRISFPNLLQTSPDALIRCFACALAARKADDLFYQPLYWKQALPARKRRLS